MRTLRKIAIALVMLAGMAAAAPAWAQAPVTAADLDKLGTVVDNIAARVAVLKGTDAALAASVDQSLTTAREDLTYLKVKLRREGVVSRSDYQDLRDRLEALSLKASKDPAGKVYAPQASPEPELPAAMVPGRVVPVGTEMDGLLQVPLSSGMSKVDGRFALTTVTDVTIDAMGKPVIAIPAGSVIRGFVSSVRVAGKIDHTGSITLSFDEVVIDGKPSQMRATVVAVLEGQKPRDTTMLGMGAAGGGGVGMMMDRPAGALVGVDVGLGGTITSNEGVNATLPIGAIIRIRLDRDLTITK